jgi:hypothetical protein
VTLVPFDVARHAKLWNYDRDRWDGAISSWLARRGLTDRGVTGMGATATAAQTGDDDRQGVSKP